MLLNSLPFEERQYELAPSAKMVGSALLWRGEQYDTENLATKSGLTAIGSNVGRIFLDANGIKIQSFFSDDPSANSTPLGLFNL